MSTEDYFDRYLGYDDVGVFKAVGRDTACAMDDGRVAELIARKGQRYESLAAAGEMLFPGAAEFIRTAVAASVPIAIASGALTHEIEDVLERAGLRRSSRSSSAPIRPSAASRIRSRIKRRSRDCARTPAAISIAWRSVAIEDSRWGLVSARGADLRCVAVTNTYSEAELRADAELVVPGLHALTLDALDALCAD